MVDLAELDFLDSAGIHALLECRARAEETGGRLLIRAPQPMVLRVLEISGVVDLLGLTLDGTDRAGRDETS